MTEVDTATLRDWAKRARELEEVIEMMIEDFEDRGSGHVTQATINRGKDALGIKYKEAANE